MRRVGILLGLATVLLLIAAPASAHERELDTSNLRDPFVPLISNQPVATEGTTGQDTSAPAPAVPEPHAERMANTGAPAAEFAGLALALIGVGGALVLIAQTKRPPRIHHHARSVA